MNIKSLRNNYDGLTMLERLSLADNAESRDDESELRAINAASPKQHFSQVDFYDLMREIPTFRFCNLIVRLSYIMQFDFFSMLAELEISKKQSSSNKYEVYSDNAAMSAFLYFRAKDSWQIVNDELGLRPNFDKEISEFLFSYELLEIQEKLMRQMAFTEDEAKEFIKKHCGDNQIKTVEDEANATREVLGLSKV